MFRYIISLSLIIVLVGCSFHSTPQVAGVYSQDPGQEDIRPVILPQDAQLSPAVRHEPFGKDVSKKTTSVSDKIELMKPNQPIADVKAASPLRTETINTANPQVFNQKPGVVTATQAEKGQSSQSHSAQGQLQ